MNGREFIRWARRYARHNGFEWDFDARKGKGSHGTFYLGNRRTTVQQGEIKKEKLSRKRYSVCCGIWA
jgi:hypothetical protein